MVKKLVLILAVVAIIATAETTVPAVSHYRITLVQPAVVQGTLLKAGEYRLDLTASKATISADNGKNRIEVPVRIETESTKFDATAVRMDTASGKAVISEIRLGGTKTKLILIN